MIIFRGIWPKEVGEIATLVGAGDLSREILLPSGDTTSVMAAMKKMVESIRALTTDANMLSVAAIEGKLATRADASKHQGDYQKIIVGVNKFAVEEKTHPTLLRVDPAIEAAQRQRLADLRAGRDNDKVAELRGQLDAAARGADNLMPLLITCVEHDVTLGEIFQPDFFSMAFWRLPAALTSLR